MARVRLPNNWQPRPYQRPLWDYLERGGKRAIPIWHRRSGKDEVALHWAAVSAFQRVGNYWHMLPEAAQARKAIWEAVNPHTGRRRIDEAFPDEICEKRGNDMLVRFANGSTWQVLGSDNFNSLVGAPPIGVVFSEWALARPAAWALIRPMLLENGGWAMFITTPRGRNHAHRMYEAASKNPNWFAQLLPATQTSVFQPEQLAGELQEYIEEHGEGAGQNLFDQEYMVSFDAAIMGAYWGKELREAEQAGRVRSIAADPQLPVHTVWDLGVGDSTAIWLFQVAAGEIRVLDHIESHGEGLGFYTRKLDALGHHYGDDWVPHDAKVRELGTGRTRIETLISLGRKPRLVPAHGLMDGINAARQTLPRAYFDAVRCRAGIEALKQYRADYDERERVYRDAPKHDWTSHSADAFRYLCMAWREMAPEQPKPPPRALAVGPANTVTFDDLWDTAPAAPRRI